MFVSVVAEVEEAGASSTLMILIWDVVVEALKTCCLFVLRSFDSWQGEVEEALALSSLTVL